jgi:hypothetical protein
LTVTRLTATAPFVGLAEKQIDDMLSNSFPASDPPSWTLGRTETGPLDAPGAVSAFGLGARAKNPRPGADEAAAVPTWGRYWHTATSFAGAMGLVLLVPIFVVLLPFALMYRLVLEVVRWRSLR